MNRRVGGRGVSAVRDASSSRDRRRESSGKKCHFRRRGRARDGDALGMGKLPGRLPICDGPTGYCRRPSRRGPWPGSPWNSRKMLSVGFMAFRYEAAPAGGT